MEEASDSQITVPVHVVLAEHRISALLDLAFIIRSL
jgi:hypothetical protein